MGNESYKNKTAVRRHELSQQPHTHRITLPHKFEGYAYQDGNCWRLELYGPMGDLRRFERCATYGDAELLAQDIANSRLEFV